MKAESAAVGPQLLRPGYCQEKQSAVDGTGGLFPRVPLQLKASGQCVGRRDGAGKTKEGVGKAARERGGKRVEEAGECSPHDQSAHPHPGCAPALSRLGALLTSSPSLSLISAFVCLTPCPQRSYVPSQGGYRCRLFRCCWPSTRVSLVLWHAGRFPWLPPGAGFSRGGNPDS